MNNHKILIQVFLITLIFISILSISQYYLKSPINQAEQNYYNQQMSQLIKEVHYDNNILASKTIINNPDQLHLLGKKISSFMYTARYQMKPTAVIFESSAPDGYNGNIDLLIAIKLNSSNHSVIKIKVLNHKETPGLGDLIEEEKSNFLQQFIGKHLNKFNNNDTHQLDSFDSITGATITSKAVNNSIKNSLLLINRYPELIK